MDILEKKEKEKRLTSIIQEENELLGLLDGYITALDGLPESQIETYNVGTKPFDLLFYLLDQFVQKDELIRWIATFIKNELPIIELGVKGILLSNMQNLIACSVDPRIPDSLRKVGLSYNLNAIDPLRMLANSPLGSNNQLYFGVSQAENIYDFTRAVDMNAFLWFVIHKGKYPNSSIIGTDITYENFFQEKYNATLVKGKNIYTASFLTYQLAERQQGIPVGTTFMQTFKTDIGVERTCSMISLCISRKVEFNPNRQMFDVVSNMIVPIGNAWNRTNYYINRDTYFDFLNFGKKEEKYRSLREFCEKEIPLCSFQYIEELKDDENIRINSVNSIYNCINVRVLPKPFVHIPHIGQNIAPIYIRYNGKGEVDKTNGRLSVVVLEDEFGHSCQTNVVKAIAESLFKKTGIQPTEEEVKETITEFTKDNENPSKNLQINGAIWWYRLAYPNSPHSDSGYKLVLNSNGDYKIVYQVADFNKAQLYEFNDLQQVSENTVLVLTHECYFGLTLYEFNYDYIMSQRLFDSKVIATQIVNMMSNFMIGMPITLSQTEIEGTERIYRIIEKIVNADVYESSDCFFKFSNEEYAQMSRDAELKRAKLIPFGDCEKRISSNKDDIIEALNKFGDATEFEESVETLSATIRTLSAIITNEGTESDVEYDISVDFVTSIIQNLTSIIVTTLLTPKVMLMILINSDICGTYNKESWKHITIDEILYAMNSVIVSIILEIRDLILKELLEEVKKRIGALMIELQSGLIREQLEVYRRAIRLLIKACTFGNRGNYDLDTVLDNVNYADIDEYYQNKETNKC